MLQILTQNFAGALTGASRRAAHEARCLQLANSARNMHQQMKQAYGIHYEYLAS